MSIHVVRGFIISSLKPVPVPSRHLDDKLEFHDTEFHTASGSRFDADVLQRAMAGET
jgi:hypothetical protein